MKHYFKPVLALATAFVFVTANVQASSEEKMMIAVQTDDFTLAETDVGELAIGESKTIETDSGKIIDILRSSDGVELYIDGELLEMDLVNEGLHEEHTLENLHEIDCESDDECEQELVVVTSDLTEVSDWADDNNHHVFVHRDMEISCHNDEDESDCGERVLLISDREGHASRNACTG
jgi:hypothetical protein